MTDEEKLAMLRSQAKLYISAHRAAPVTPDIPPWVEEELWLLELVDKQDEQLRRTYCTYCGTEFLLDDAAGNQVTEHIYTCREHPMWRLQEQVRKLEAEIAQYRDEMKNKITAVQRLASAACPECKGLCVNCTPGLEVSADGECATCYGSGVLVPGLRRKCLGKCRGGGPISAFKCPDCQGRGWELIPQVEQMGVLVRVAQDIAIWQGQNGGWRSHIRREDRDYWGYGETPEAAVAHAICQVEGVE